MQRIALIVKTIVLGCSVLAIPVQALTCQQVKQLTGFYLKFHYSFDSFDDELSKRTLENMVKNWDPGKLYFYKSDIVDFKKRYSMNLDDMALKGDCSALAYINNIFAKRFEERHKKVNSLLKQKFDFKIDEYLNLDRKKNKFASNSEELDERWRKRVKFQYKQLQTSLKTDKKIRDKIGKRYNNIVKWQNEKDFEDVFANFLNSFAAALDPHSEYMMAEQLEDFRIDTKLSLEGIGAVLRSEDGFTIIQSLVPGGAAFKTKKIKADDKIIAVAQGSGDPVDVIDMQLREVVRLIRGTAGTVVNLTLLREDGSAVSNFVISVKREKVQLEDRVAKSKVYELRAGKNSKTNKISKIGVLDLPSFYVDFEGMHARKKNYRSSYRDSMAEIAKLKKANVDGVIVDLRSNGGGSLDESVKIAGMFFDQGPVVQVKDMDGKKRSEMDPFAGEVYSGPLVILINRQSASASEILAGAIQDYQRGLIVGDSHTFGKGTVQNLQDLGPKLGAVKITISKFYRPSGSSTQLRGVGADIVIPSLVDQLEIGEENYDHALPWDQIGTSEFTDSSMIKNFVSVVKKRSSDRVQLDPFFDSVREDIKKYKDGEKKRFLVSLKNDKESSEADKNKKNDADTDRDADEPKLDDDPTLQEALRITSDYARLLKKQKPAYVHIPGLKLPEKIKVAKNRAAKKDVDKLQARKPKNKSVTKKSRAASKKKK
jgi:carboxyl-terminal processing protease